MRSRASCSADRRRGPAAHHSGATHRGPAAHPSGAAHPSREPPPIPARGARHRPTWLTNPPLCPVHLMGRAGAMVPVRMFTRGIRVYDGRSDHIASILEAANLLARRPDLAPGTRSRCPWNRTPTVQQRTGSPSLRVFRLWRFCASLCGLPQGVAQDKIRPRTIPRGATELSSPSTATIQHPTV